MPHLRRKRLRRPERSAISMPDVFAENCCDSTDCSRRTSSQQCTAHCAFGCVVGGSGRGRCSTGAGIQGIVALTFGSAEPRSLGDFRAGVIMRASFSGHPRHTSPRFEHNHRIDPLRPSCSVQKSLRLLAALSPSAAPQPLEAPVPARTSLPKSAGPRQRDDC